MELYSEAERYKKPNSDKYCQSIAFLGEYSVTWQLDLNNADLPDLNQSL